MVIKIYNNNFNIFTVLFTKYEMEDFQLKFVSNQGRIQDSVGGGVDPPAILPNFPKTA